MERAFYSIVTLNVGGYGDFFVSTVLNCWKL